MAHQSPTTIHRGGSKFVSAPTPDVDRKERCFSRRKTLSIYLPRCSTCRHPPCSPEGLQSAAELICVARKFSSGSSTSDSSRHARSTGKACHIRHGAACEKIRIVIYSGSKECRQLHQKWTPQNTRYSASIAKQTRGFNESPVRSACLYTSTRW